MQWPGHTGRKALAKKRSLAIQSQPAGGLEAFGGLLYREHRATTSKSVVGIQANQSAFCAILEDGDTLVWGDQNTGGQTKGPRRVCAVQSTDRAFAALTSQGTAIRQTTHLYSLGTGWKRMARCALMKATDGNQKRRRRGSEFMDSAQFLAASRQR